MRGGRDAKCAIRGWNFLTRVRYDNFVVLTEGSAIYIYDIYTSTEGMFSSFFFFFFCWKTCYMCVYWGVVVLECNSESFFFFNFCLYIHFFVSMFVFQISSIHCVTKVWCNLMNRESYRIINSWNFTQIFLLPWLHIAFIVQKYLT